MLLCRSTNCLISPVDMDVRLASRNYKDIREHFIIHLYKDHLKYQWKQVEPNDGAYTYLWFYRENITKICLWLFILRNMIKRSFDFSNVIDACDQFPIINISTFLKFCALYRVPDYKIYKI